MREFEAEFKRKGAHLAVVGLGDATYAKFFREKTGIQFPLLIDDQREAYKTVGLRHATLLHLLRKDNLQARKRAKAAGHQQHRLGKDPLQLGGSFVFAPGNKDLFIHMS
ncbi:MAG TPA: peroxiredoxin-like family protein, partial [Blattabacteriaceae bacterium]|nr:peroxiredoxin-like family protein [Blattabacteriaceae bacterium]